MRNWDSREYRRINNAILSQDRLLVSFENGDVAEIPTIRVLPFGVANGTWNGLRFDAHTITAQIGNQHLEVPWSTIRAITDPEFGGHIARQAEEQAKTIGTRIRKLRESRHLASKELAERAGISPQSLSRIENGRHDVVFTTLGRILGAMGYSLRDLANLEVGQNLTANQTAQEIERNIWTKPDPPVGQATARKSVASIFDEAQSNTPSNTPGARTPGVRKLTAA